MKYWTEPAFLLHLNLESMASVPDLDAVAGGPEGFGSGGPVTPDDLADGLARLVWESFSDFVMEPTVQALLDELGITVDEGLPGERAAEELLILHLWAHTRTVQLSFFQRAPEPLVRATLDGLHQAIFQDMVEGGTPRHQLPVFEQRMGARYAEYYEAAQVSDAEVGRVAVNHLCSGKSDAHEASARILAERIVEVANPLRDYLDELELTGS